MALTISYTLEMIGFTIGAMLAYAIFSFMLSLIFSINYFIGLFITLGIMFIGLTLQEVLK